MFIPKSHEGSYALWVMASVRPEKDMIGDNGE
jgi:hypothetical protein